LNFAGFAGISLNAEPGRAWACNSAEYVDLAISRSGCVTIHVTDSRRPPCVEIRFQAKARAPGITPQIILFRLE
jgi:hypothetical protein